MYFLASSLWISVAVTITIAVGKKLSAAATSVIAPVTVAYTAKTVAADADTYYS